MAFLLSIAPEKGTLGAHKKKTVGHYLCNLHGGYAPADPIHTNSG